MEDFFFKYKEIIESLSKERVQELVRDAKDYMISSGGLLALPDKLQPYDFLLFPTPWPKRLFNDAWEVQKDFNLLVHKVSHDFRFVKEALKRFVLGSCFIQYFLQFRFLFSLIMFDCYVRASLKRCIIDKSDIYKSSLW